MCDEVVVFYTHIFTFPRYSMFFDVFLPMLHWQYRVMFGTVKSGHLSSVMLKKSRRDLREGEEFTAFPVGACISSASN